jgi:hypothetical protein
MPDLAIHVEEWMEDAKRVVLGDYKQVLEDGGKFSSDSEAEGDGKDDSELLGKISEGRHQMSQEQVHAWHMARDCRSQLHSETQAGPTSAAADSRA